MFLSKCCVNKKIYLLLSNQFFKLFVILRLFKKNYCLYDPGKKCLIPLQMITYPSTSVYLPPEVWCEVIERLRTSEDFESMKVTCDLFSFLIQNYNLSNKKMLEAKLNRNFLERFDRKIDLNDFGFSVPSALNSLIVEMTYSANKIREIVENSLGCYYELEVLKLEGVTLTIPGLSLVLTLFGFKNKIRKLKLINCNLNFDEFMHSKLLETLKTFFGPQIKLQKFVFKNCKYSKIVNGAEIGYKLIRGVFEKNEEGEVIPTYRFVLKLTST